MANPTINFKPKLLCIAVCLVNLSIISQAYAEDHTVKKITTKADSNTVSDAKDIPSVELETIVVTSENKVITRKDNEITGLGKVVKSKEDINKEQVLGIRDLTRYDPGVSITEQGRGASTGYAIRGVDKNRVSLMVDGIPQIQSYVNRLGTGRNNGSSYNDFVANSGAINEIEFENIKAVEISKGASSTQFGNGALGGGVSFRTKEASDVIKNGQNWGLDTKTAYSSKNNQLLNSISVAGEANGFEALAVYTKRSEEETKPHSAAKDIQYVVKPMGAAVEKYDLRVPKNTLSVGNWYVDETECPDLVNCTPKSYVSFQKDDYPIPDSRKDVPLTPEEQADYNNRVIKPITLSAEDYTGNLRTMPNPLDKKNDSLLLKGGYHISDEHYVGAVYENTNQNYDIRDMSQSAYYPSSLLSNLNFFKRTIYPADHILHGIIYKDTADRSLYWSQAKFIDESHQKNRVGVHYDYQANDNNNIIDSGRLSFDHQKIDTDTQLLKLYCAPYPVIDKNCRPSLDKPWSAMQTSNTNYKEEHNLLKLNLAKALDIKNQTHNVSVMLGADKFSSDLKRSNAKSQTIEMQKLPNKQEQVKDATQERRGSVGNPRVEGGLKATKVTKNLCKNDDLRSALDCKPRNIDGYNYFVALQDNVYIGDYLDLGFGVRYDKHKFNSDETLTQTGSFDNWSWNGGIVYMPNDYIDLSYRISSGFRVPAFNELYGTVFERADDKYAYKSNLKPEKSLNQEFGITVKGDLGFLETSYFINDYDDLIDTASIKGENGIPENSGYHNLHNVKLAGINVLGKVDGNALHESIPLGIYGTVAYNRIDAKKRGYDESKFTEAYDPALDAIQPGRYVLGLGYDAPSEKWGINWNTTYSEAKKSDEVASYSSTGVKSGVGNQYLSKSWYTHDVTGYLNLNDNFTFRAGIYNLLNRKYSTWESVRQSGLNAINQDLVGGNDTSAKGLRFAAPGINFGASLEMKF